MSCRFLEPAQDVLVNWQHIVALSGLLLSLGALLRFGDLRASEFASPEPHHALAGSTVPVQHSHG